MVIKYRTEPLTYEWLLKNSEVIPETGCINWLRCKDSSGYGQTHYEDMMHKVHRLSYRFNVGKIPDGLYVCHTCDNPLCFNYQHLFLGTQSDNMKDMVLKGRSSRGQERNKAKLTQKEAMEVFLDPGLHREVAAKFGIATCTVTQIKTKRTWAWMHE